MFAEAATSETAGAFTDATMHATGVKHVLQAGVFDEADGASMSSGKAGGPIRATVCLFGTFGSDFRIDFRFRRYKSTLVSGFDFRITKVFFFDFRIRKSKKNTFVIRKSNPETKVLLYRRKRKSIRKSDPKVPNKQTVARMGPPAFPEDIEAPSASSKTPACKTCFTPVACIVASVKAPAVSDVAASANIHTAPVRRNANNADAKSRLPAVCCNIRSNLALRAPC